MNFTYEVYPSPYGGWGYRIKIGNIPIIDQPFIPCVGGYQGFATEAAARTVAEYIIQKAASKGRLEGITLEELVQLGVIG